MKIYNALVLVAFSLTQNVSIAAESKPADSEFKQAYSDYQKALEGNDFTKIEQTAKRSYELGCEIPDNPVVSCIELKVNYASSASTLSVIQSMYLSALEEQGKLTGENSMEVAELALIILDDPRISVNTGGLMRKIYDHVDRVADKLEPESERKAGVLLFRLAQKMSQKVATDDSFIEAYQLLKENAESDNTYFIQSLYFAAKYKQAEEDYDESIELAEQAIAAIKQTEFSDFIFEQTVRRFLVGVYNQVREHKKANQQIVEIGKLVGTSGTDTPALYRFDAGYPRKAARRGIQGWVMLQFDLDEHGRPTNIKVIDNAGGNIFNQVAQRSLSGWQFLPQFVDGKAIELKDRTIRLDYSLSR